VLVKLGLFYRKNQIWKLFLGWGAGRLGCTLCFWAGRSLRQGKMLEHSQNEGSLQTMARSRDGAWVLILDQPDIGLRQWEIQVLKREPVKFQRGIWNEGPEGISEVTSQTRKLSEFTRV
jgi:hypothetical protein